MLTESKGWVMRGIGVAAMADAGGSALLGLHSLLPLDPSIEGLAGAALFSLGTVTLSSTTERQRGFNIAGLILSGAMLIGGAYLYTKGETASAGTLLNSAWRPLVTMNVLGFLLGGRSRRPDNSDNGYNTSNSSSNMRLRF